ncbi:MAG: histidine phosphatase family protein [Beijerinckiaceae bacterium]|nr:histidine phosphatase family protein [Beijerinckiaceae bacterium]
MLRLMLLRHAKAVPHGAAPDFDRALDERGQREADEVGVYLKDEQLWPDLALVSPSLRTRQTWERAAASLDAVETLFDEAIYDAEAAGLQAIVRAKGGRVRTLLVCAHNPGIEDFATQSVGFGDRYAFARMKGHFAPAALAVLDFDLEQWSDLQPNTARLDRFRLPMPGH